MENSISKSYEINQQADGSVAISFPSWRWGSHAATRVGTLFMIFVWPTSCAVTYPITGGFNNPFIWTFGSALLAVGIMFLIRKRRSSIVVKPNEGIIFDGKSIPFVDINSIGTMHETTGKDPKGTSYVYVETNGQEVRISGHVKPAMASAVKNEIKTISGLSWK